MSENIFTELYNRVLSLFGQTVQKEENTKNVACNRLRVVLMQDRTNITPELLQRMRKELIELLSKYVELDKEALELNFEQEGEQMALMLSIPVVRAKDEAEIEQALKADEKSDKKDDEENSENESSENDSQEENDAQEESKNDDKGEETTEENAGKEDENEETTESTETSDDEEKDTKSDEEETNSCENQKPENSSDNKKDNKTNSKDKK